MATKKKTARKQHRLETSHPSADRECAKLAIKKCGEVITQTTYSVDHLSAFSGTVWLRTD